MSAEAAANPQSDDLAVAKRMSRSINKNGALAAADFTSPLGAKDEAALRRFWACKVESIDYTLMPDPTERDVYVQDRKRVFIAYLCKGVPRKTPVGITLHFQDGRIATVETHNADLMRGN